MATAQCETSTSNAITLKGSTELVTEFFGYAVNNILFQRGVYPPEEFERKQKYGLGVMVTTETKLREYLVGALEQVNDWLMGKDLKVGARLGRRAHGGDGGAMDVRRGDGRRDRARRR